MQFQMSKSFEKHFPRKETVLLRFDKSDSEIERNWSKSGNAKDAVNDKS